MTQSSEKRESRLAAFYAIRRSRFNDAIGTAMSMLPYEEQIGLIGDMAKRMSPDDRPMFLLDLAQFGIHPDNYKEEQRKLVAAAQDEEAKKSSANHKRSMTQRGRKAKQRDAIDMPPLSHVYVEALGLDGENVDERFDENG